MKTVRRLWQAAALLGLFIPAFVSCGDDSSGGTASNAGGSGGGGTGGSATGGQAGDASVNFDSSSCQTGNACGDGGICAGGVCCDKANACGNDCCSGSELCSFQKCVTPGKTCTETSDCAAGEYCELALGSGSDGGTAPDAASCTTGFIVAEGKCLPQPPECTGAEPGLDCLPKCELPPSTAGFDPEITYTWGGVTSSPFSSDVMMTPIVIQLDDDNCDGKISEQDIPEIVFLTFAGGAYTGLGTLHAISVVNGQVVEKFATPGILNAMSELAGGNIDGKPGNEVVGCSSGSVSAFDGKGQKLWTSPPIGCRAPALADLEGDGTVEVVVEGGILNGADGTLKHAFAVGVSVPSVSDLDGDGKLDIADGRRAYRADGTLLADCGVDSAWAAVGDLDKDGKPEIVGINPANGSRKMHVWRVKSGTPNFEVVRAPFDIHETAVSNPCGHNSGGGPPTIADFNGDTVPDVALAGSIAYVIFDGKKLMDPTAPSNTTLLWQSITQDCSSAATGSSVFDFNGDGKAEAVYSDEIYLRVYDGATGNELWKTCNTTGTLIEYPVVADVDNDGQADIVVASNAYAFNCGGTKQSGIRIIQSKSKSWVRTRRVWNQHTYHITNVDEDGTIPTKEVPNWTVPGLNNFRQNKQPGNEFAAPDAVVTLKPRCAGAFGVLVEVRNLGQAPLPKGVKVEVFSGTPPSGTSLAITATTIPLYAAQAELLSLDLPNAPADVKSGATQVYATVTPPAGVIECRTDNNSSNPVAAVCNQPR
ncbi:MAG: VCBS repeat-containing protein [Myxococcales bacterium]|nr:VCBS repeat-containing protein [Myxococcales bacterium]